MQELVFCEERCENEKCLKDYGINREFIKQVGCQICCCGKVPEDVYAVRPLHLLAKEPSALHSMVKHTLTTTRDPSGHHICDYNA